MLSSLTCFVGLEYYALRYSHQLYYYPSLSVLLVIDSASLCTILGVLWGSYLSVARDTLPLCGTRNARSLSLLLRCLGVRLPTYWNVRRHLGNQHEDHFRADKTYTLIQRLAHNVIKTGLRKINSSYSRVSLQDLCAKVFRGVGKAGGDHEGLSGFSFLREFQKAFICALYLACGRFRLMGRFRVA